MLGSLAPGDQAIAGIVIAGRTLQHDVRIPVFIEIAIDIGPAPLAAKDDGAAAFAVGETFDSAQANACWQWLSSEFFVEEGARLWSLGVDGIVGISGFAALAGRADQKLNMWQGHGLYMIIVIALFAHAHIPKKWGRGGYGHDKGSDPSSEHPRPITRKGWQVSRLADLKRLLGARGSQPSQPSFRPVASATSPVTVAGAAAFRET